MKHYIVQITDKALADMEEIYTYIAEQLQAPESALGQYNRIAKAIEGLELVPERVRLMESEPERSMGLRQFPIDSDISKTQSQPKTQSTTSFRI